MSPMRKTRSNRPARGVPQTGRPPDAPAVGVEALTVLFGKLFGSSSALPQPLGPDSTGGNGAGLLQTEPGIRPTTPVPGDRGQAAKHVVQPGVQPTGEKRKRKPPACHVCGRPSEYAGWHRRRKCMCYGQCNRCHKPMWLTQSVHFTARSRHHIRCCDGDW